MFKTQEDILKYLYSYIRMDSRPFDPDLGLKRTFRFLELLENPQDKLKVIHIAGTSGKGSTAYYLSRLLASQGFKTGLHISPHLVDLRERFQVNNTLISVGKMGKYLEEMKPVIDGMDRENLGRISYFEILVGLAFFMFEREGVDYAVVETGFGGQHDATNTVHSENKVAVLTKIGLDHTDLLGSTVEEITSKKAKIIHPDNMAVANWNTPSIREVIEKEAKAQGVKVDYVKPGETFYDIRQTEKGALFNFRSGSILLKDLQLSTPALYQAENAATALEVLTCLSRRDGFRIRENALREALSHGSFAGRMEALKVNGKTVILDGAHNPQKMEAFLDSLNKAFPDRKSDMLIAFKKGKNYRDMLKQLTAVARSITATRFRLDIQDSHHQSEEPENILRELNHMQFAKGCSVGDPVKAFDGLMQAPGTSFIVVTGSLYLLSCLHTHIHAYTHRQ